MNDVAWLVDSDCNSMRRDETRMHADGGANGDDDCVILLYSTIHCIV